MLKIKIYDFKGNLVIKKNVDNKFMEEIFTITDLLDEEKALDKLSSGFKYYSASQNMWIHVEKESNLKNVLVFQTDFESGTLLKIQLNPNLIESQA